MIHVPTGKVRDIAGGEAHTTNNRMEMKAALEALRSLTRSKVRVAIYSDSSYLVQAFNQNWLERWQRNGWRTSARKEVENQDLWQGLLEVARKHSVTWEHVKGHAGHEHNEACDQMAREQSELQAIDGGASPVLG